MQFSHFTSSAVQEMAREERHKSTHTGHLWDLHEARRYSEPPIDILTFRDWLEKHDFKVTKLEQNSLKAIGAQTPNLNWKVRLPS